MRSFNIIIVFYLLLFTSCSSYFDDTYELATDTKSLAVPIAFGKITLQDIIDRAKGDTKLRIDGDGRITALYSGEILRDNASKIFPPVPGIIDFVIFDTIADLPLPVNGSYRIDKGIFDNTNMAFKFRHNVKEQIHLVMRIPSVNIEGVEWKKEYDPQFCRRW